MARRPAAAPPTTPWTIPKPAPGVAPDAARMAMDDAFGGLYNYAGNSYGGTYGGEGMRFLGYPILSEMAQRSEYRRLVGTLAQEMTRRFVRLTSTGDDDKADKIQKLDAAMKKFRVRDVFREAAEADGFFGIGHIYIDTDAGNDPDELKTPLMAKSAKIGRGSLKRLRTIEPIWCYPGIYGSNDPLNPNFYRPQSWYVMSREIHRTRLLSLVSREVPDILKPAFMFGGLSLTQLAQPTVDNWLRTRKSVNDLIHSFTVWRLSTDMGSTLQGGGSELMSERAELFNLYRDNSGLMMINKETEEFGNVAAPIGGLDHLQSQAQEHMAAIDGMPLIKLVGYTPSGLNSTGEGEMDAWRDRVRAQQEHLFNEPLKQVMDIIQLSEFGEIDEDIGFEWEPLEDPNEAERAVVRKTDIDAAVELIAAGVISPEEERERLANSEESLYHGIDVSDVPEPPENEEQPTLTPDPAKGSANAEDSALEDDYGLDAEFTESDHPRDEDGKFASGGSGGSGSTPTTKRPKLTSKEKSYISTYTGDDFFETNKKLRAGEDAGPSVKHIDGAIEKQTLPAGTKLYRRMTREAFLQMAGGPDIKRGDTYSDPAFLSTAREPILGVGGIVLEIETKGDQKGLDVAGLTRNPSEKEVLLPRNTKLSVKGIAPPKKVGDPVIVKVAAGSD